MRKEGMRIKAVGITKIGDEVVVEIQDMDGKYHVVGREHVDSQFGHWWNLPQSLKATEIEAFRLGL